MQELTVAAVTEMNDFSAAAGYQALDHGTLEWTGA